MIAHGVWDISAFFSDGTDAAWLTVANLLLVVVGVLFGVLALVSIWRTDRDRVVAAGRDARHTAA